ncbi:hypothetical protein BS50DRAFT_505036, partial [Corynespora cassiicola Philippines]
YASCRSSKLSLPIPRALRGFTTALPIISGLLLEAGYDLTRVQERRKRASRNSTVRPPFVIVANTLIFIYSTVVITLLGTHVGPPSGLDCGLHERWQALFRQRNVESIRAIQDANSCCGFRSIHDMAWPFPDKNHQSDACEKAFGRTTACFGSWKAEEQRVAGILMGAVGLVFLWQFLIIAVPTERESWLHKVVPGRISDFIADEEHGSDQRAIDYLPNFNRYSDRVEEEVEDSNSHNGPQRAIEGGIQQAKNIVNGRDEDRDHESSAVDNAWTRN